MIEREYLFICYFLIYIHGLLELAEKIVKVGR